MTTPSTARDIPVYLLRVLYRGELPKDNLLLLKVDACLVVQEAGEEELEDGLNRRLPQQEQLVDGAHQNKVVRLLVEHHAKCEEKVHQVEHGSNPVILAGRVLHVGLPDELIGLAVHFCYHVRSVHPAMRGVGFQIVYLVT